MSRGYGMCTSPRFDLKVYGLILQLNFLREVIFLHQALYRKWRPSTFDDVCGQEHITSVLKYEVENAKTSHAYLFCGSRGTGKTTCSKILAKAVNCESPIGGNPCGKCAACLAIENGTTTDVLEMDAASNNGVDNIRDIRDEVVYSPSMLKYRVYIVDEVHMLSQSAFNALLKTLEEPPAHVVFILATTELNKLPATIISRCQRFDFRRISVPVLTERLLKIAEKEEISIQQSAAQLIARLAQGGMRDAISLLDLCAGTKKEITEKVVSETVGISGRDDIGKVVRAIVDGNYELIFDSVAEIVSSSKDIAVFLQDILSFYRDMLVMKTSKNAKKYLDLTESETEITGELAALYSRETLAYHCGLIEQTVAKVQKNPASARISAEMSLIKLCDPSLDSSVDSLLSRISALEDKIDSGIYAPAKEAPKKETAAPEVKPEPTPAPKTAVPQTAPAPTGKKKALPYWIEAVDKICKGDPSLVGFLKQSRIYKDENGKIVLRVSSDFTLRMIKARKSTMDAILLAISTYEKRQVSEPDLTFEISNENDIIDEGRENIAEIIKENNL